MQSLSSVIPSNTQHHLKMHGENQDLDQLREWDNNPSVPGVNKSVAAARIEEAHVLKKLSLDLSGGDFADITSLPALQDHLQHIDLGGWASLTNLPPLPSNLVSINLNGCISLEALPQPLDQYLDAVIEGLINAPNEQVINLLARYREINFYDSKELRDAFSKQVCDYFNEKARVKNSNLEIDEKFMLQLVRPLVNAGFSDLILNKENNEIVEEAYDQKNAYQCLQSMIGIKGVEDLKDALLNSEDDNKISWVRTFFNSVNSTKKTEQQIKELLKNPDFIAHIHHNLIAFSVAKGNEGKENFIVNFKQFELFATPVIEEREAYGILTGGICHGSCQLTATTRTPSSLKRENLLNESTNLQKSYLSTRNPNPQEILNLLATSIIAAVNDLPAQVNENKLSLEKAKKLIETDNEFFLEFLRDNNIDITAHYAAARIKVQDQDFISAPELHVFHKTEIICDRNELTSDSVRILVDHMDAKVQEAAGENRHLFLITFIEKAQIRKAIKGTYGIQQAHDILIRIDTNSDGNMAQMFFSDLQEVGIYNIVPTDLTKNIGGSMLDGVNLINSYFNDYAVNLFEKFTVKYSCVDNVEEASR